VTPFGEIVPIQPRAVQRGDRLRVVERHLVIRVDDRAAAG
jgi:hypothetical protein